MNRSAYLSILLLVSIASVALTAAFNWVVDPLRYYHSPWFETGYSDNQRYQNPGLVKHEDFDTVLIGTSHTEHFTSRDMNLYLGGRSINLSMSGSTIVEQNALLEYTLDSGKVRRVLWEINYPSFSTGEQVTIEGDFPFFLYRPGAETPFRYLMSWDTLQESVAALSGTRSMQLDEMHRWDLEFEFGAERVLANWDYMQNRWNNDLRDLWRLHAVTVEALPALFDHYVSSLVRKHPEVSFELLLLPTSILDFSNDFQVSAERFRKRLLLRDEVAALVDGRENVKAWDFQLNPLFTEELSHYKDLEHFDGSVTLGVLKEIGIQGAGQSAVQLKINTRKLQRRVVTGTEAFCRRDSARCQPAMMDNLESFQWNLP